MFQESCFYVSTYSVKGQGVQVLSRAEGQKIRTRIPWEATNVTSICIKGTFATLFLKNCKGTLGPKDKNLDVSPHCKDYYISSRWEKPFIFHR